MLSGSIPDVIEFVTLVEFISFIAVNYKIVFNLLWDITLSILEKNSLISTLFIFYPIEIEIFQSIHFLLSLVLLCCIKYSERNVQEA